VITFHEQKKSQQDHKTKAALIISAIKERAVLEYWYDGFKRLIEPQCYGLSYADHEVLRGYQIGGGSNSRRESPKLFEVEKMKKLRKTEQHFAGPHEPYNPDDSAMKVIYACLLPHETKSRRLLIAQ
jgi:hypothetical protein